MTAEPTAQTAVDPAPSGPQRWPLRIAPIVFVLVVMVQILITLVVLSGLGAAGYEQSWINDHDYLVGIPVDVIVIAAAVGLVVALTAPVSAADLGLRRAPLLQAIGKVLVVLVVFYGLAAAYGALVHLKDSDNTRLEGLNMGASVGPDLLAVLFYVVLAPLAEEVLFRGVIFRSLRDGLPGRSAVRVGAAALISGLVFGALHVGGGQNAFIPTLILLGIALALAYQWTGSLYASIAIHAINNAVAVGSTIANGYAGYWLPYALGPVVAIAAAVAIGRLLPSWPGNRAPALATSASGPTSGRPDGL